MSSLNIPTISGYKPLGYFYWGEYDKRFKDCSNETVWTQNQQVSFIEDIILAADEMADMGITVRDFQMTVANG